MPLSLQENELVTIVVSTTSEQASSAAKASRQRAIVMNYVAKVESRLDDAPPDGYTNRDHDRLIYGK
jgi:hypothetical protein